MFAQYFDGWVDRQGVETSGELDLLEEQRGQHDSENNTQCVYFGVDATRVHRYLEQCIGIGFSKRLCQMARSVKIHPHIGPSDLASILHHSVHADRIPLVDAFPQHRQLQQQDGRPLKQEQGKTHRRRGTGSRDRITPQMQ